MTLDPLLKTASKHSNVQFMSGRTFWGAAPITERRSCEDVLISRAGRKTCCRSPFRANRAIFRPKFCPNNMSKLGHQWHVMELGHGAFGTLVRTCTLTYPGSFGWHLRKQWGGVRGHINFGYGMHKRRRRLHRHTFFKPWAQTLFLNFEHWNSPATSSVSLQKVKCEVGIKLGG